MPDDIANAAENLASDLSAFVRRPAITSGLWRFRLTPAIESCLSVDPPVGHGENYLSVATRARAVSRARRALMKDKSVGRRCILSPVLQEYGAAPASAFGAERYPLVGEA